MELSTNTRLKKRRIDTHKCIHEKDGGLGTAEPEHPGDSGSIRRAYGDAQTLTVRIDKALLSGERCDGFGCGGCFARKPGRLLVCLLVLLVREYDRLQHVPASEQEGGHAR